MPHFHDVTIDADGSITIENGAVATFNGTSAELNLYGGANLNVGEDGGGATSGDVFFRNSSLLQMYGTSVLVMNSGVRFDLYGTMNVKDATGVINVEANGKILLEGDASLLEQTAGSIHSRSAHTGGSSYVLVRREFLNEVEQIYRRWYIKNATNDGHVVMTVNAYWNGTAWERDRDPISDPTYGNAYRIDYPNAVDNSGVKVSVVSSTVSDPFADSEWDNEYSDLGFHDNAAVPRLVLKGQDIGDAGVPWRGGLYRDNITCAWGRVSLGTGTGSAPVVSQWGERFGFTTTMDYFNDPGPVTDQTKLCWKVSRNMETTLAAPIANIRKADGSDIAAAFAYMTTNLEPASINSVTIQGEWAGSGNKVNFDTDEVYIHVMVLGRLDNE